MGDYQKVAPKQYPSRGRRESAEGKFWRNYGSQHSEPQFGPVTCVHFSPVAPHPFAITSSTRVIVYSSVSRDIKRQFSRFKDVAYSGQFRSDGKLLVAGGESSVVQVFDCATKTVLRRMKGHTGAVHATQFCADKVHVVSAGDDHTVRLWDIATQQTLTLFNSHTDYARSLAPNPASPHLWASGGYDHQVILWDTRTPQPAMMLSHGHPVEDAVFFPSGALLASAGARTVVVWDIVAGGRRLCALSNHQKTVTCLTLSSTIPTGPANRPLPPRLLTGSLDCHVKMYSTDSFKVVHASLYPAPVLSLGISPSGSTIAVGMASGLLAVRHRRLPERAMASLAAAGATPRVPGLEPKRRRRVPRALPLTASNFRYFLRGRNDKATAHDFLVAQRRRVHLAVHDKMLRRFRYSEALNASLETGRAEVVTAVIEELIARNGLLAALSNRHHSALLPLLSFVAKNIVDPRHAPLLLPLASRLLDLYASQLGLWPAIDHKVFALRRRLKVELETQEAFVEIQGMLEPLIRASTSTSRTFV